ncbi:MAG: hypothetical protein ROW52_06285, partial [Anaerolineaceae bacterium]
RAQRGFIAAKIFEYLAARRPILAIGSKTNEASTLIMDRNAGFVSDDATHIATRLQNWIGEKVNRGFIPALPIEVCKGLSRDEQFAKIDNFLLSLR